MKINNIIKFKKLITYPLYKKFEISIKKGSWIIQNDMLSFEPNIYNYEITQNDKVYNEYIQLFNSIKNNFYLKRSNSKLKILLHIPDVIHSPGGFSLFNNLKQGLKFLGVKVEFLLFNEKIQDKFSQFKPNIFLSSDHTSYLSLLNWDFIAEYKKKNILKVGLTASLEEYGNTSLMKRLAWARKNRIDFYYSFRADEYLSLRKEYYPFYDSGFKIYSVEFGANPLIYYPVPGIKRDLNFVFLASRNSDKWLRYSKYLSKIFSNYEGLIDGPGWSYINKWLPPALHKYAYARAKVGINLHIPVSIDYPSELNERTYILAASGIPQLIDKPLLLEKRFSPDSMFVAETPNEYFNLFEYMLSNYELTERKTIKALREVYEKHTIFHRADLLINHLEPLLNI